MLTVIGDFMWDQYVLMETTGRKETVSSIEEAPIVSYIRNRKFAGGAGLVCDIIEGLGHKCVKVGDGIKPKCQKCRSVINDTIVYRLDIDDTREIDEPTAESLLRDIPPDTEYLLVADYGKGVITEFLYQQLLKKYRIIVDPAKDKPFSFYNGAFGIIPNRKEAGVTYVKDAILKADSLRSNFENVCIKLDCDGMVVSTNDGFSHIKSVIHPSQAIDTCGAGDVVLASIGVALEDGKTWEQACVFANAVAGQKCKDIRWKH